MVETIPLDLKCKDLLLLIARINITLLPIIFVCPLLIPINTQCLYRGCFSVVFCQNIVDQIGSPRVMSDLSDD